MSQKAKEIARDVNATMTLEGLPLSDLDIELMTRTIDGVISREEAFQVFNAKMGINTQQRQSQHREEKCKLEIAKGNTPLYNIPRLRRWRNW